MPLVVDRLTNAPISIDYAHHEIHEGSFFSVYYYATGKNDGETINVYFKTPASSPKCHSFFQWSSSGAAYGRIYEAPAITANTGTNGQTIFNRNRDSATASTVVDNATSPAANKYGYDVTKTGNGTIITAEYSGIGKTIAGYGRSENEFVLKANTAYLFEVESDAAGLVLSMQVGWYEE